MSSDYIAYSSKAGVPFDPNGAQAEMRKAIQEGDLEAFMAAARGLDEVSRTGAPDSWDRNITRENTASGMRVIVPIVEQKIHLPGHAGMIRELMRRGMDIDETRDEVLDVNYVDSPLIAALCRGTSETVKTLLVLGADPNRRMNADGRKKDGMMTPLSCLLGQGSPQLTEYVEVAEKLRALLDAGATFAQMTKFARMRPLEIALKSNWNAVQALLELGENPHQLCVNDTKCVLEAAKDSRPGIHARMCAWIDARSAIRAIDEIVSPSNTRGARP